MYAFNYIIYWNNFIILNLNLYFVFIITVYIRNIGPQNSLNNPTLLLKQLSVQGTRSEFFEQSNTIIEAAFCSGYKIRIL